MESPLGPRFEDALVYANRLHATQRRKKSGIPYISHLLAVTALVMEAGGSEDDAIAALLHDAVEDQGGPPTRAEIAEKFGESIAATVEALSDTDEEPKPPWQARKEAYLAALPYEPPHVLLISSADKLHNVRCLVRDLRSDGDAMWQHFRGGREGTLWYYRQLVEVYRQAGGTPLLPELEAAVEELVAVAGEQVEGP